jgi:hypothetical protein
MLAFVVVELQRPGHSLEHRLRRTREVSALEAGVVVDAHPCEHGDLLAPQALHPTYGAVGEQPSLLGLTRARRLARKSRTSPR